MNCRHLRSIAYIAIAVLANGCFSIRDSDIPMVDDIGADVSTKHRYKLACVYKGDTSETLWFSEAYMSRCYPRVFSADGLPIALRIRFKTFATPNTWAILLSMCSMTVIPAVQELDSTFSCTIELVDAADCNASFELVSRFESAFSFGLPTAFLLYNNEPTCAGHRVFFETERSIGTGNTTMPSFDPEKRIESDGQFRQGLAYAIAVKLKELEDSGMVDAMLDGKAVQQPSMPSHSVVRFDRDSGGGYSFAIDMMQGQKDLNVAKDAILKEFAKSVKEEYLDTFPNVDLASLSVAFPNVKVDGLRISGRAVVLTVKPIALAYDSNTRHGKLSVRFNAGMLEEARAFILKNIEALARDKNIALVTGEVPPAAAFYVLGESLKDDNLIEVEFKTE